MAETTGTDFYVTGGTLQRDAPSYVERQADKDLYEGLQRGEFCYGLTSRQMGKSSLMVHTAARLREAGVSVVVLDLTAVGQNLSAEQWYGGLLRRVERQLDPGGDLEEELDELWFDQEARVGPLERWMAALENTVLPHGSGRVVLFIDEIDAVRSLPFSTDEFFAAIRECYNRRAQDQEFQRLTFCLLGVATPSDLIQDTRTTPSNIGTRIDLTDFSAAEAGPLATGLGRDERTGAALLERVLYWTGGHPYLTQRLCQAVARDENVTDTAGVDRQCEALFLSAEAREKDDNLLFVRERLLKSEADRASLLDLYGKVRVGQRVGLDDTNPLLDLLRLSGITRVTGGQLRVRNRIDARVFDRAWVTQHMPDAELRRQKAAYRRGLVRASAIAAAVVALMAALTLAAVTQARRANQQRRVANQQRSVAEAQRVEARRNLYVAQMNLAQQSWEEGNVARAQELLDAWRPEAGQEDLRGFEWRFLWRLCQEPALLTFPGRTGTVTSLAFSPDGHTMADSNADATIRLWDLRAKDRYPPGGWIASLRGHIGFVHQVAFSPNGQTLASCSDDKTVRLWDVARHREAAVLRGHRAPVLAIAFSPDGRTLASAGGDRIIRLWDVARRQENALMRGDAAVVTSLAFAPNGRVLSSASADGSVQLWDPAARRAMATLRGHANAVNSVAFSPDGRLIASASDDATVKLWDPTPMREVGTLWGHRAAVTCLAFSPSEKTLVTGSRDDTVRLWDLAARRELATFEGHKDAVTSVAFSPDGETIASGGAYYDQTIHLWDPSAKGDTITVLRPKVTPRRRPGAASAFALSLDGKTLATGHPDGTVEKRNVVRVLAEGGWAHASHVSDHARTGGAGRGPEAGPIAIIQAHAAPILALQFSPDGKKLATGSQDRTVKLWDVTTRQCVAALRGFTGDRYGLAFAPGSRLLAMRSGDRVKLWDLGTRRATAALEASPQSALGVEFSPDGKLLIAGDGFGRVKLWDAATLREAAVLTGRASAPLVLSPDGKTLACNGYGPDVALWDLAARRVVGTLRGLASNTGDLAFSPDAKTLAVASANAIVLYNIAVRQPVATLKGHTGPVTAVAFSRDGNTLVSAAGDGTIRLWRAATWQEADRLNVFASGADRRVRLQWSQSTASAYQIYRGPAGASGAQLTRLNHQPVAGNSFLDQSPRLVNGQAQPYAVAGVFPDGDGRTVEGRPVIVPATPVAAPPGFWGCSINESSNTGSARFDAVSGGITISGSGSDVWMEADGFYYLSQPVTGDFQITVEALTRPTGSQSWAPAGLMVRETLAAGARNSFLALSHSQGLEHKWRPTANEDMDPVSVLSDARLKLPILLRITRQGDRITPTYSEDNGHIFQPAGDPVRFFPALTKTLYAGLAITSQDPTEMSEAKFRNLVVTKL